MVYRVCVEKKPGLAPECASLLSDCRSFLDLKGLESVRIWNRYDVEGIDEALFAYATNTVFSEPQLDLTSGEIDASGDASRKAPPAQAGADRGGGIFVLRQPDRPCHGPCRRALPRGLHCQTP